MTQVITEAAPADQPESRAAPARPAWCGPLPPVAVIVAYLALGFVAYWPVLPGISRRLYGRTGDYTLSAWFIGWVPHALAHGLNPFYTHAIFAPSGVNLAQNTESALLGFVAAPITELWGPIVATNLLMVAALPLSATAAFIVLRKWDVWLPAAALGGLLYGFSAFMVGQGADHLVFTFAPLPPFIALVFVSILRRRGSPWKLGVALGLLVAAQYLICQELLADTAIVATMGLVCVGVRYPTRIAGTIRRTVVPFGTALALAAALLAYPVWMLVAGPEHATVTDSARATPFYNDLLSFVVPGPLQQNSLSTDSLGTRLMKGTDPTSLGGYLGGSNPDEVGAYIGLPLLLLAAFLVWRSRRTGRIQLVTVLFLMSAALSLGSYLVVNAHATHVPLPYRLIDHIPLVRRMFPSRISSATAVCFAAVIAFGLDNLHRTPGRRNVARVISVVVLVSLVATQLPRWPYGTQPVRPIPASVSQAIAPNEPLAVTFPFATALTMQPLIWQMQMGYRFSAFGGYAHATDARGQLIEGAALMQPPDLQRFLSQQDGVNPYGAPPPLGPALVASTRSTLAKYHVRLIIVDRSERGSGAVIKLFTEALGPSQHSLGRFSLWLHWKVPAD